MDDIRLMSGQLKLAGRESQPKRTVIDIKGIQVGGADFVVIAGPCSVENRDQLFSTAGIVKSLGADILRGGIYKPRTSPYTFQGLEDAGIGLLSAVRDKFDMPVITEVMDPRKLALVSKHADILQIGSRNMHNTSLLKEVGQVNKPVLLKRGMSATIEEFLFAAEYILEQGNNQVILCERGIRTFEPSTRFTLDIGAIPVLKKLSHLPVIVDPSHGTGHWWMVPPLAKAAIAAGADGVMIEVHPNPETALSDGQQSLNPDQFKMLMEDLQILKQAIKVL